VKVHGSRVTQVVRGVTPHTEPFEEQTSTMIVFPQGAVLRLATAVNVGQMLVLTNLKTRQDAICRVVKVRANANLPGYIEVEFTHQQPGYWGVTFPSQAPPAASQGSSLPSPAPTAPELKTKDKLAGDVSWRPAPPPISAAPPPHEAQSPGKEAKPAAPLARFTPPPKTETSFISIGSQEDVQASASATAAIKPGRASGTSESAFAPSGPSAPTATDLPPVSKPAPSPPVSIAELRGDAPAIPSDSIAPAEVTETSHTEPAPAEVPSDSTRAIFGRFSSTASSTEGLQDLADTFGARLDSSFGALGTSGAESNQSWMLVAAAVAVLAVGLMGGIFYFRHRPSNSPAPKSSAVSAVASNSSPAPAIVEQAAPAAALPPAAAVGQLSRSALAPNATPAGNSGASPVAQVSSGASAPISVGANSAGPAKAAANVQSQPQAMIKPVAPSVTPDMVSKSLNAHPSAPQRDSSGEADAAPVFVIGAGSDPETSALAGISSSSGRSPLPPAEAGPAAPVQPGGVVTGPRLKSSVLPMYPPAARQSNVQGDVVINTTIDKTGSVTQMKVVSGPAMLRQAALDALRRWKYEPSKLDGQPVDVQMLVTIKFRR
jgi:protein TonB